MSFESLSESARLLMTYISFLSPDHISQELFMAPLGKDRDSARYRGIHNLIWESGEPPELVEFALSELCEKSLIDLKRGGYRVHRLTQSVFRMTLQNPEQAWDSTAGLISASYPGKEPDGVTGKLVADRRVWPTCRKLNPHVETLFEHRFRHFDSVPFEFLLNQSSIYFGYNRMSRQALKYSVQHLRRKKRRLPPSDIDIGRG